MSSILLSSYEHSIKIAARCPVAIFGAASSHTPMFLGDNEMLSGSTSPNIRTSRPLSASLMKYALES
ncbi:hypothetical protein PC116_g32576 [Phytophthora cactorum]|nr:hypothetical protein PC116_g32576 [Phytophthora cactorum]